MGEYACDKRAAVSRKPNREKTWRAQLSAALCEDPKSVMFLQF